MFNKTRDYCICKVKHDFFFSQEGYNCLTVNDGLNMKRSYSTLPMDPGPRPSSPRSPELGENVTSYDGRCPQQSLQ